MSMTHHLQFQTANGTQQVLIASGETVLVTGPNGVGKSALLATLYRSLPKEVSTYLPGHRQINFNNGWEMVGQDFTQLRDNLFLHVDAFSRYKGAWAEDQFKHTVKTLLNAENAFNREYRTARLSDLEIPSISQDTSTQECGLADYGTNADKKMPDLSKQIKVGKQSPVDQLNVIFAAAGLPVSFILNSDGFVAQRDQATYGIEALSDGERASLFIAAAFISQKQHTVLLIDEPEKHLHPSITILLVQAALRVRPDLAIVLSTHDIHLISQLSTKAVIHIRNSAVLNVKPEMRIYEAKVFLDLDQISEELKTDLLGARSKILFIEGASSSLDASLYRHVYPLIKISPRGSHSEVSQSVRSLLRATDEHWIRPFGLIDGDGRSESEVLALASDKIYVLSYPTVENLFFLEAAREAFVASDLLYTPGHSMEQRFASWEQEVFAAIQVARDEIIARRTSWLLERELSAQKLSVSHIRDGKYSNISISVDALKERVSEIVDYLISSEPLARLVLRLPIKNTPIPNVAAKALGASSFDEYRRVLINQLEIKSKAGILFLAALKSSLPELQ